LVSLSTQKVAKTHDFLIIFKYLHPAACRERERDRERKRERERERELENLRFINTFLIVIKFGLTINIVIKFGLTINIESWKNPRLFN